MNPIAMATGLVISATAVRGMMTESILMETVSLTGATVSRVMEVLLSL
jgi:hypothetical protein